MEDSAFILFHNSNVRLDDQLVEIQNFECKIISCILKMIGRLKILQPTTICKSKRLLQNAVEIIV